MSNKTNFLTLEGNVNDLLMINNNGSMKMTRLINIEPTADVVDEEIIDVAITSTNEYCSHPFFDKLLNKKIRIRIDIIE